MTAIIKNGNIFLRYFDTIVPVDIPPGTITWNFFDDIWFALEDRMIIRSSDDNSDSEILMDNKGLISFFVWTQRYVWVNCIVRFFEDKIITNIDGKEKIILSTIGQRLLNLINIEVITGHYKIKFVLDNKKYCIGDGKIECTRKKYNHDYTLLWMTKDFKFYKSNHISNSPDGMYAFSYNGSVTTLNRLLKKELFQGAISSTCILYDNKKIVFYDRLVTVLEDDEEPYTFIKPGYNTKSARF